MAEEDKTNNQEGISTENNEQEESPEKDDHEEKEESAEKGDNKEKEKSPDDDKEKHESPDEDEEKDKHPGKKKHSRKKSHKGKIESSEKEEQGEKDKHTKKKGRKDKKGHKGKEESVEKDDHKEKEIFPVEDAGKREYAFPDEYDMFLDEGERPSIFDEDEPKFDYAEEVFDEMMEEEEKKAEMAKKFAEAEKEFIGETPDKESLSDIEKGEFWEDEAEATADDWEKAAKEHIQIDVEPEKEKRRSICELESYAASGPTPEDILKLSKPDPAPIPRTPRYSITLGIEGIARINLSPLTQKIVGCVIGENVTTEYPWIFVKKEIIQDNLDLHSESSDFLPVKEEVEKYPELKMLIGYAPSVTEEGQFYICLTEEGKEDVMQLIQSQRKEHEDRVRNAVFKPIGVWYDKGSAEEVDGTIAKSTRPLFEIEVLSGPDVINAPINFVDRKADDQRDGYVELLPYRQTFNNISRRLISRGVQVMLPIIDNEAQTTPSMPANSWFQYKYEYDIIDLSTFSEEKLESLKMFLDRYTNRLCDEALTNATWDMYMNDYMKLPRNEKDTQPPVPVTYVEHQSYRDGTLIVDKVISDLSWHPVWTGIAMAAYTTHSKSDQLVGPKTTSEVHRAFEDNNKVLVWSFTDCLSPKLILESPREVTSVATCPYDGNVIVGGCASGQIVIWDIPGKIEQVEAVIVRTNAQVKYRVAMANLMTWMRNPGGLSIVRPAAMSALQHSQKGAITQIVWVPAHQKVDKDGRIQSLPADTSVDELSWQFVTSSTDGTIAFWDLRWRPQEKDLKPAQRRRKRVPRPEALTQLMSPLKVLDRILKPDYILMLQYPDENRKPIITTLTMYSPKFRKVQVEPFPINDDDIKIRRFYKPVIEKPDYVMEPLLHVGTVEGDFGCVTWEGFDFATGATINREQCKWVWLSKVHDGPITHSVRSKFLNNVIATIGGKIFAVWREDFPEPLIWKRSDVAYTAGAWGNFRPTILILARMDGSVEIWDFIVKSHESCFTQSLSGQIITGIYTHELHLNPQCVGFCDFHGTLRMFLAPRIFQTYDQADIQWMKNFVDRQVARIKEFKEWQKNWNETNIKSIELKKQQAESEARQKRQEAEEKLKAEAAEAMERLKAEEASAKKKLGLLEEGRRQWIASEMKRMQTVILEKKGLKEEVLEKQRGPVMKLRQDIARKKHKIREALRTQDKKFEETVAFLFPEQHYQEHKEVKLPPVTDRKPSREEEEHKRKSKEEDFLNKMEGFEIDPFKKTIEAFLKVEEEALTQIETNPVQHVFNWKKVVTEGKRRRRKMDIELHRKNKRKVRRERESQQIPLKLLFHDVGKTSFTEPGMDDDD